MNSSGAPESGYDSGDESESVDFSDSDDGRQHIVDYPEDTFSGRIERPTKHVLVAYDYSGSTSGVSYYHESVAKYLSVYEDYDVILWDDKLEISTKRNLQEINRSRSGRGCTEPLRVGEYLHRTGFTGKVILITDGQIDTRCVRNLDGYLSRNEIYISHITCVLVDRHSNIDASVIAPFIRRVPHDVIMYNGQDEPITVTSGSSTDSEFLAVLEQIKTIEEFQSQFEKIRTELTSKMIGMGLNTQLRDAILALQQRIMKEMKSCPQEFDMQAMKRAFESGDVEYMNRSALELHESYMTKWSDPVWPAQIFELVRIASGDLQSNFSLGVFGSKFEAERIRRADVVKQFGYSDIESKDVGKNVYVCPVSYEEERDILILVKKPEEHLLKIVEKEDKVMVNSIITNPLMALKYPNFCKKLVALLDHPISVNSMREAERVGCPMVESPITRSLVIGGLCLAPCEDHCKATDSVIAMIAANGKKAGSRDLWFMLIWYLIERGDVPYLRDVLPQIREHMVFRMKNHVAPLSLSNSPYTPVTLVPLGIAVWCSLCGCDYGLSSETSESYLNSHLCYLRPLRQSLDLVKYPVAPKVDNQIRDFALCTRVKWIIKKEKTDMIVSLMRSAYKRVIQIERENVHNEKLPPVKCIPIDSEDPAPEDVEKALRQLPKEFRNATLDQRRFIIQCLLQGRSVTIEQLSSCPHFAGINWGYGLNTYTIPKVPICAATCRPYSSCDGSHWSAASEKCFGSLSGQISIHRYYKDYVIAFKQHPTKEELLLFVYQEVDKPTLPHMILDFVECALDGYSAISKDIPMNEFLRRVRLSGSRRRRAVMEQQEIEAREKKQ